MSDTEVGVLLSAPQERDAIHVALACVLANGKLYPGQRITLVKGSQEWVRGVEEGETALGIVDPYLQHPVHRSDRFWMFLLPRTVTGLKHVWSHPAFKGWETTPTVSEPELEVLNRQVKASEQWLRDYVNRADCGDYDELLAAARAYHKDSWDEEYMSIFGSNAHGLINPALWDHLEVVTGLKFEKRATYFSCSC